MFFFLTSSPATKTKGSAVLTKQQKIPESMSPPGTGAKNFLIYSLLLELDSWSTLQSIMLNATF